MALNLERRNLRKTKLLNRERNSLDLGTRITIPGSEVKFSLASGLLLNYTIYHVLVCQRININIILQLVTVRWQ